MSNAAQHSLDWYRCRLGKITGSRVGVIMGKGKGTEFTKTGITYLNSVAAEQMLPAPVVENDELFAIYLEEMDSTSKAMRIGTERESEARDLYEQIMDCKVHETGCTDSSFVKGFASSPDGLVLEDGVVEGTIEIKCPKPSTYLEYLSEIKDADSLLSVNPEYYWQCMSHIAVSSARWCDFITYCPYNRDPIHIVRIKRDEDAIKKLHDRAQSAISYVQDKINGINN